MLLFADTETTGVGQEDRLCQMACKSEDGSIEINELFKPPLSIKITAMAVHGKTEKMVADKPAFKDSPLYPDIKDMFSINTIVAHNAQFDVEMLKKEGVECESIICTFKLACFLDVEGKMESYSEQYLRYRLGIEIEEGYAHDAYGDVLILEQIYHRLAKKLTFEEMIDISSRPALLPKLSFGKHRGELFKNVDHGYLGWIVKQDSMDENVKYTAQHWLGQ